MPLIATVEKRFSPPCTQWHDKRHKYPLLAFRGLVHLLVAAVQVPAYADLYPAGVGGG